MGEVEGPNQPQVGEGSMAPPPTSPPAPPVERAAPPPAAPPSVPPAGAAAAGDVRASARPAVTPGEDVAADEGRGSGRPGAGRWIAAAAVVLVAAVVAGVIALRGGSDDDSGDDVRSPYPAAATEAFLAEVRKSPGKPDLANLDDNRLVTSGDEYCDALKEKGSSLGAVFELQLQKKTFKGQVYVTTAARRHLCPELPDRDERQATSTTATPTTPTTPTTAARTSSTRR